MIGYVLIHYLGASMTPNIPDLPFHPPGRAHEKNRIATWAIAGAILLGSMFTCGPGSADENSIREYLAQTRTTAYLQQGDFRLDRVEFEGRTWPNAVVFQKFIQGIPLHGGRVIVFESPAGQVTRVFDDSSEPLKLNFGKPAIDSTAAENLIEAAHAIGSTSKLVWFRIGNEAILAWEVTTALADSGEAASPTGLETVIDATNGHILSQRQLDSKTYEPGSPEYAAGVFPRIVINDAIGPIGSRNYAAPFDAIVEADFGCTGVLIADNVVLSARHCGIGAGDTIIFGDNANGGGIFSATVQSSFLPAGGGSLLDGGDVSILTLTASVPANIATPMRLIDETEGLEGMVCATLGYGFNGVGSQGHNFTSDGRRWGGENIIDVYGSPASSSGSNIISTDFDNGSAGANEIPGSSPTPLEFEATTAPGDSGGPVLVQVGSEWLVAGVLSGGTTSTSVYGDISWWTGTAVFRSAIEARGGEFVGSIEITFPNGIPEFVSSNGGDTLDIEVIPSDVDAIVPGSGTFHVDTGSGFQQLALIENSATDFTAVFPASECLTTVQFYVSFELASGATIFQPPNAPADSFSVTSAVDFLDLFVDSFDTDTGWSVSGPAVEGRWQRAIPNNGDRGDPSEDAEADGNGFCFVTDNNNTPDDNSDVDGGETILTSPVMNASGGVNDTAFLSYFRWYSNDFGGSPNADIFVVEISNDGGATWVDLETVGPAGAGTSGGWIFVEHQIDEFLVPTNNMRVRFTASDFGAGSVVEAAVDAVAIRLFSCEEDVLRGDVNLDGVVNLLDVAPFVDLLSTGDFQAEADVNNDGSVDLLDVDPFIALLSS